MSSSKLRTSSVPKKYAFVLWVNLTQVCEASIIYKQERLFYFRSRPGTKALQEIRFLQRHTNLLIPKLPFMRLVKEFILKEKRAEFRIQSLALDALQEASEAHIVRHMEDSVLAAVHAGRVTVMPKDMKLVSSLKDSPWVIDFRLLMLFVLSDFILFFANFIFLSHHLLTHASCFIQWGL